MSDGPIVFFDGVCNLCDSFVRFLMKIDKKERLRFASLQGETAKQKLSKTDTEGLKSVTLLNKGHCYKESLAVLEVFNIVGGAWRIFIIFNLVPAPIRNWVYKFIARNRYKWFGKKEKVCPMQTANQRAKMLP